MVTKVTVVRYPEIIKDTPVVIVYEIGFRTRSTIVVYLVNTTDSNRNCQCELVGKYNHECRVHCEYLMYYRRNTERTTIVIVCKMRMLTKFTSVTYLMYIERTTEIIVCLNCWLNKDHLLVNHECDILVNEQILP